MDRKTTSAYSLKLSLGFAFQQIAGACAMSFASVYLLNLGYHEAYIGLIVGTATAISTLTQPFLGVFVDSPKRRISLQMLTAIGSAAVLLLSLYLLLFAGNNIPTAVALTLTISAISCVMAILNNLYYYISAMGYKINYGLSRGIGSVTYAAACAVMGVILEHINKRLLPAFYMIGLAGLIVLMFWMRSIPNITGARQNQEHISLIAFIAKYRRFILFSLGSCLLCIMFFATGNVYTIQIVSAIGGGTKEMGYAIALAAGLELPAMTMASRIAKKIPLYKLLRFSSAAFLLKYVGMLLAKDMTMFYVAQLFQIFSFGLFYPSAIAYIPEVIPAEHLGKGQGLFNMLFSCAMIIASYVGGFIIRYSSVSAMMTAFFVTSVMGILIIWLTVEKIDTTEKA